MKPLFEIVYNSHIHKYDLIYNPSGEDIKSYKHEKQAEKKLDILKNQWVLMQEHGYEIQVLEHYSVGQTPAYQIKKDGKVVYVHHGINHTLNRVSKLLKADIP